MLPRLTNLWLNVRPTNGDTVDLRADFSNDWHCAVPIAYPFDQAAVVAALQKLVWVIEDNMAEESPHQT